MCLCVWLSFRLYVLLRVHVLYAVVCVRVPVHVRVRMRVCVCVFVLSLACFRLRVCVCLFVLACLRMRPSRMGAYVCVFAVIFARFLFVRPCIRVCASMYAVQVIKEENQIMNPEGRLRRPSGFIISSGLRVLVRVFAFLPIRICACSCAYAVVCLCMCACPCV